MNRHTKAALRAGATAVAAASGLMVLASTGQTPSGFVPAAFGGPLGLFDTSVSANMTDVLAIGDGPADAKELAALLKSSGPTALPAGPLQATIAPGALPNTSEINVLVPSAAPEGALSTKQSLDLKPVLDNKGQVDCSQAVSCQTDPATNVTTVTFADGVVAVVQRINDLTLIAYKTVGDVIGALVPGVPGLPAAALSPTGVPKPPPVQTMADSSAPSVDAGPSAPSGPAVTPDITASKVRPKLTISTPPQDFNSPKLGGQGGGVGSVPPGNATEAWNKLTTGVKDAVGSVVDTIGKALGPGAATKPGSAQSQQSQQSQQSPQNSQTEQNAQSQQGAAENSPSEQGPQN